MHRRMLSKKDRVVNQQRRLHFFSFSFSDDCGENQTDAPSGLITRAHSRDYSIFLAGLCLMVGSLLHVRSGH